MNKPTISERFDMDDIRAIRNWNSLRHTGMTPAEIVADTRDAAAALMQKMQRQSAKNQVRIISNGHVSAPDLSAS